MVQSPEVVWSECLEFIRDNVGRQGYNTWFMPIRPLSLEEDGDLLKLTVELPSRFFYEWLEAQYYALIRKTVTKVLGPQGRLYYEIVVEKDDDNAGGGTSMQLPARLDTTSAPVPSPPLPPQSAPSQPTAPHGPQHEPTGNVLNHPMSPMGQQGAAPPAGVGQGRHPGAGRPPRPPGGGQQSELPLITNPFAIPGIQRVHVDSQLNDSYHFESFIEGDCNRLARSAALAIAEKPGGTSYNPFLIYGISGLGKTHLIHAIGNYAKKYGRAKNVLAVSSERFTSEFVQAIKQNKISEFSIFYRQIDLLIVDDVQFFGGKDKTQEEFFHLFNALHQSGKQIVMSADRAPRDINGIEDRLLSRFNWGLVADMKPPEYETRMAILLRKAEDEGTQLPNEVIEFVAQNVKTNIRELEGALIKLTAHAALHRQEVDLAVAKDVLRDHIQDQRINLTVEQIQSLVCEYFGIPEDLVRAKTRKREVVQARQVAMYFARKLTQHSLKTIGLQFGGRDHTTVIHATRSVDNQIETDSNFRESIEEIAHKIEMRSR